MAKAGVGALGVVLLAVLIFLVVSSWSRQPAAAKPSAQPINFPHNTHVQTSKLACQYCHSDARRSEYAGLPSVQRCLGCHKIGENGNTLGPNLTEIGARLGPDAIARTLVNPTSPMPSYAALQRENPEQFDKLVEYVASLKGEE